MTLRWYSVVVDSHDVKALARWWAQTLDFVTVYEDEHEIAIIPKHLNPDPVEDLDTFLRTGQGMVFVPVEERKTLKNRLHIDLAPHTSQDRDALIAELVERGASRVDVGQPDDVPWTVLADPEGNEFCVLSSRDR